jgi:hypothetical protein
MHAFKDTSTKHRTQLEATVQVGRKCESVSVSIPGRDIWAHQMARIELQNRVVFTRRKLEAERTLSAR